MRGLVLTITAALAAPAARAAADAAAAARHDALLRDLTAEAAQVRETARQRLEQAEDLTEDEIRSALAVPDVDDRARPLLYRVAAARGMKGLVPEVVRGMFSGDPATSDAAVRALVTLGPDAVRAGEEALRAGPAPGDARAAEGLADVLAHLRALHAQRTVERAVLSKWRRKGGSYEGRYADLAKFGWPVQPVLLAMLLDVPLRVRHLVLRDTDDPDLAAAARQAVLQDIVLSQRRGYRTFDPLPWTIEADELFDLAAQALKDVADLDLLGDILEETAERLEAADASAGWRLRPVEKYLFQDIDVILAARGRPRRLERLARERRSEVRMERMWLDRVDPEDAVDQWQRYCVSLRELAMVVHQLRRFDEAASLYAEAIKVGKRLSGKEPAFDGYNRACALARAGRLDEALEQLGRALDPDVSSGSEDLTREWVTEDGDLAALHDDPRYRRIIERHFR